MVRAWEPSGGEELVGRMTGLLVRRAAGDGDPGGWQPRRTWPPATGPAAQRLAHTAPQLRGTVVT